MKLTSATLISARTKLAKRKNRYGQLVSNATVNRYLAAMSHALSTAENQYQWISENPMRRVPKLKETQRRDRALNLSQIKDLLSACRATNSTVLETIVLLALTTGMRKSEITNLSWDKIDLEDRFLIVERTKNGERRRVTLTEQVAEHLKMLTVHGFVECDLLFQIATIQAW